jgi:hypothetical protein
MEETFRLMEEISPTAVVAMIGLRIFPGTGLARQAEDEGLLSPATDFLEPVFYLAPAVKDRVVEIARRRAAYHPNWILPGLSINVSLRLQSKLRRIGLKVPLGTYEDHAGTGKSQRRNPCLRRLSSFPARALSPWEWLRDWHPFRRPERFSGRPVGPWILISSNSVSRGRRILFLWTSTLKWRST